MKTLDEFNEDRRKFWEETTDNEWVGNGISCPKCGEELADVTDMNSGALLPKCTWPPEIAVLCNKCGYLGNRIM